MKQNVVVTLILILNTGFAKAQASIADTATYPIALAKANDTYKQFIGREAALYNGPVFTGFNYTLQSGSQYFIPVQSMNGKVMYNGVMYTNIPLMFDVLNNKLISKKPSDNQSFELLIKQVGYFELDNHKFTHLQSPPYKNMPAGFYEILFEGNKSNVYEIHTKLLREDLEQKFIKYHIEDRSNFYIKKDSNYFKVAKNNDLFRIFEDHEADIRSFVKRNKLKLHKNPIETLIKVAAHFETL